GVARGLPQHLEDLLRDQRLVGLVALGVAVLPLGDLRPPLVYVEPRQQASEPGQDVAQVPDDRHVSLDQLRDLCRVDVDVDDGGVRGEAADLTGHAVIEAQARTEDQVAVRYRPVGRDRAVHSRHADELLISGRVRPDAHERRDDRDTGEVSEGCDLLRSYLATTAYHHDGPFRRADGFGRLLDLAGVAHECGPITWQVYLGLQWTVVLGLLHVLRHVDEHGTGPSGAGDVERLGQDAREVVDVLDEVVVLGDGAGDAEDVRLLEGVRPDEAPHD